MSKRNIIVEVISCLFILLFFYTGLSKVMDYKTFEIDVINSPFVKKISPIISIVIPVIEMLVAIALLLPKTKKIGMYFSFSLMILFTLYVGFILVFAKSRPCTCGGVLREMSWSQHLWFNIFFTLLGLIGIILMKRNKNSHNHLLLSFKQNQI